MNTFVTAPLGNNRTVQVNLDIQIGEIIAIKEMFQGEVLNEWSGTPQEFFDDIINPSLAELEHKKFMEENYCSACENEKEECYC
jgi:hypothetical protein